MKALNDLAEKIRERKAGMESASNALPEALSVIEEALSHNSTTETGRRLRQIVWSTFNAQTLIVLGEALTGFDPELGFAVAKLLGAKIAGVDLDDLLRGVLMRSGEMARMEAAIEQAQSEGDQVLYPGVPCSAEWLLRLGRTAAATERRIQDC